MQKQLLSFLTGVAAGSLLFLLMIVCTSERKSTAYWHGYRQAMMNSRDKIDHHQNYVYDEKRKGQMPEL